MDSSTSIQGAPDHSGSLKPPHSSETAFSATWQASDATLLQPNNLSISKVQRGWDRKPLNPFSKQRLRVGKVWKRAAASQRLPTSDATMDVDRASKRRKALASLTAPLKPVKKMCLDSNFGMAPRVLRWEIAASPARKIVTRSTASEEDMLALPDVEHEDPTEGDVDVTVEILDEDGTVLEVGGEELGKEADWQDEMDSDEPILDQDPETTVDQPGDNVIQDGPVLKGSTGINSLTQHGVGPLSPVTGSGSNASIYNFGGQAQAESRLPVEDVILPEGFISPAKRSSAFPKKFARKSLTSRRRTLPVQFAPSVTEPPEMSGEEFAAAFSSARGSANSLNPVQDSGPTDAGSDEHYNGNNEDSEELSATREEWEDLEEDLVPPAFESDFLTDEALQDVDDEIPGSPNESPVLSDGTNTRSGTNRAGVCDNDLAKPAVLASGVRAESKLPSSPIPTIGGQHPRLPLRRSPRRKSSSPLKHSAIFSSTESSHLIALTPIRATPKYPSPSVHPGLPIPGLQDEPNTPEVSTQIERAASAPSEEATMSPQKPSRPRVSDDTALLQAFLNRAAESRSSRRVSASQQESITNRRDSDTVRQALASPAKSDVLADLDPNTPSPRKSATGPDNTDAFDGIELGCTSTPEQSDALQDGLVTRRSDRATRRGQLQTPAAPNKIAIRGNAEYTVLKKTEAQELAILTRNNTRKNKGGAILPPLRLHKLATQTATTDQGTSDGQASGEGIDRVVKIRGVRWAEALVEFYQGGEASESSILSDELNVPPDSEQQMDPESEQVSAVPPPSETPSKPKLRRLKPNKTASTPAKIHQDVLPSAAPETEESTSAEPAAQPPSRPVPVTKRRSRIATPAKGLTTASLLPSDIDRPASAAILATQGEKKAPSKKKTATSKLPGIAAPSTSLGQGKENLFSSPPKKKLSGPPSTKTFAPKLDLGNKTQLPADEGAVAPGLASPAKKGRGKNVTIGNAPIFNIGTSRKDETPGLSSPAKKRTRRTGIA